MRILECGSTHAKKKVGTRLDKQFVGCLVFVCKRRGIRQSLSHCPSFARVVPSSSVGGHPSAWFRFIEHWPIQGGHVLWSVRGCLSRQAARRSPPSAGHPLNLISHGCYSITRPLLVWERAACATPRFLIKMLREARTVHVCAEERHNRLTSSDAFPGGVGPTFGCHGSLPLTAKFTAWPAPTDRSQLPTAPKCPQGQSTQPPGTVVRIHLSGLLLFCTIHTNAIPVVTGRHIRPNLVPISCRCLSLSPPLVVASRQAGLHRLSEGGPEPWRGRCHRG